MNQIAKAADVSQNQTSRRGFLNKLWVMLGIVALGELLWMAFSFIRPKKGPLSENPATTIMSAGSIESFSAGSVTAFQRGPFYLVRLEDEGYLALSCKCTHLGCTVPWREDEGQFHCPCHSSLFSRQGEVIGGPAPRPLDLFPVSLRDGDLVVDTSRPIEREAFDSSQVFYLG